MSDSAAAPVGEIVGIQAQATARTGRFIISAGSNHFISDAKPNAGGPGEAVAAGQLLLASLASCGLGLIQGRASDDGIALSGASVDAAFQRDPDDGTRYAWIGLTFALRGVDQPTAERLLAHFTGTCPIFNTLQRGGTVWAKVVATA